MKTANLLLRAAGLVCIAMSAAMRTTDFRGGLAGSGMEHYAEWTPLAVVLFAVPFPCVVIGNRWPQFAAPCLMAMLLCLVLTGWRFFGAVNWIYGGAH